MALSSGPADMLYQERGTDSVSNLYNIKIMNKTVNEIPVQLKLEGEMARHRQNRMSWNRNTDVKKEGQGAGSFFIVLPRSVFKVKKDKIAGGIISKEIKK